MSPSSPRRVPTKLICASGAAAPIASASAKKKKKKKNMPAAAITTWGAVGAAPIGVSSVASSRPGRGGSVFHAASPRPPGRLSPHCPENSQREHREHERRTAERDKRQRHAGDRHQPDDSAHV